MEITKIGWGTKSKKSLRTTIPVVVCKSAGLDVGNFIKWTYDKEKDRWYIEKIEG